MFSLHKIAVSVLLIFFSFTAHATDYRLVPAGAAEAGMGFSCIAKPGFWSSFSNQGLISFNKSAFAGISYENRFGISELGTRSLGVVIPVGRSVLGATYSNFGYRDLMRHSAGVACGMKLSEKISAGVQVDFFAEKTPGNYNELRSLTFEAGLVFIPSEKTMIGIEIFNPVPDAFRKSRLHSSLRIGVGIKLTGTFYASSELEMATGRVPDLRAGFEYKVAGKVFFRGGFSSMNTSFSFGAGYRMKSVAVDFSVATHERLGISSSLSVIFQLNKTAVN